MNKDDIIKLLPDYDSEKVEKFASYCIRLLLEKEKVDGKWTNNPKNPWMARKTAQEMATLFKRVAKEGLDFDGAHVTLQNTGISYDHVVYKNKMILAYPESKVDMALVYKGDGFAFSKESGRVEYSHQIANPFGQKDEDVAGAYCVIKNKRGEFLTTLSPDDIKKHRMKAKTDSIWKQWFKEMCLKTVVKKGCKQHFEDVYRGIEEMDNENYDLESPVNIDLEHKQKLEAMTTVEEVVKYYREHSGLGQDFDLLVKKRRDEIVEAQKTNDPQSK